MKNKKCKLCRQYKTISRFSKLDPKLCSNCSNFANSIGSNIPSLFTPVNRSFEKFIFPIMSVVYPNLIAQELFNSQTMIILNETKD